MGLHVPTLLLYALFVLFSNAKDVHVTVHGHDDSKCGTSAQPCGSVRYAINVAESGDAVLVHNGTYQGGSNIGLRLPAKAITIRSLQGPQVTVMDFELAGPGWRAGPGASVTVDGFTFMNGFSKEDNGGCFSINGGSSVTLSNMVFMLCHGKRGGAVYVGGGASPILSDLAVYNSSATYGGALSVEEGSSCGLSGSTFKYNRASGNGGAVYVDASSVTVTKSSFSSNGVAGMGGAAFVQGGNLYVSTTTVATSCDDYGYQIGCAGNCEVESDKAYRFVCQPDPDCSFAGNGGPGGWWYIMVPFLGCVCAAVCCTAAVLRAIRQRRYDGYAANVGRRNNINADGERRPLREDKERFRDLGEGYTPTPAEPGEKGACIICFENKVDCCIVDCMHCVCCGACARKIDNCPVCRNKLKRAVRLYFST